MGSYSIADQIHMMIHDRKIDKDDPLRALMIACRKKILDDAEEIDLLKTRLKMIREACDFEFSDTLY